MLPHVVDKLSLSETTLTAPKFMYFGSPLTLCIDDTLARAFHEVSLPWYKPGIPWLGMPGLFG